MTTLSTHVLDAGRGLPAARLALSLSEAAGAVLTSTATDDDGRVRLDLEVGPGDYVLRFETGAWFTAAGRDHLHPWVPLAFSVAQEPHLHLALLLGPWSYTTYRGS